MWRLLPLLLLQRVSTEECPNTGFSDRNSSAVPLVPRAPRVIADVVGLREAKELLKEAVVVPASMPASVSKLFVRSGESSAVLLVGPSGLGKVAVVEAAAQEAGAQVLLLPATQVVSGGFCRIALNAKRPIVVIVEALDSAPHASVAIRQCLREVTQNEDTISKVFIVATMSHDLPSLSATALVPFGYTIRLGLPSVEERKQFLLKLFQQISRVDPQWSVAFSESAVSTLANLTSKYTFGEIELVVRRAFIRSTNAEGSRDPVALHHFEQILASMPPQASEAFNEAPAPVEEAAPAPAAAASETTKKSSESTGKKNKKEAKDPMDGIFGWCNFWLPEALHLPPVVWAMIIFGILAHFMARSTYQSYGHRGKRGRGNRSFLGDQLGGGGPGGFGAGGLGGEDFMQGMNGGNWMGAMGGAGNFPYPGPPGMEGLTRPSAGAGRGEGEGGSGGGDSKSSSLPTAGEPKSAGPP